MLMIGQAPMPIDKPHTNVNSSQCARNGVFRSVLSTFNTASFNVTTTSKINATKIGNLEQLLMVISYCSMHGEIKARWLQVYVWFCRDFATGSSTHIGKTQIAYCIFNLLEEGQCFTQQKWVLHTIHKITEWLPVSLVLLKPHRFT